MKYAHIFSPKGVCSCALAITREADGVVFADRYTLPLDGVGKPLFTGEVEVSAARLEGVAEFTRNATKWRERTTAIL